MLWYCASAMGAKARWADSLPVSANGEGRCRAAGSESECVEELESEVMMAAALTKNLLSPQDVAPPWT